MSEATKAKLRAASKARWATIRAGKHLLPLKALQQLVNQ
jgi:hypothetical protein